MTPEQWKHIERHYHSAIEKEPGQRAVYLRNLSAMEPVLGHEVESLLALGANAQGFIETTALEITVQDLAANPTGLDIGQSLDRYQLIDLLGEGGMGVVYAARDRRLARTVALKFLRDEFTGDPQAVERLYREARILSALNHPNICTVYDIAKVQGRTFLAMECLEGKSLHRLIAEGPLPLNEVFRYALQITDALVKTHGAGIVHGDLKPGNILVTCDGQIKLLDFGLARTMDDNRTDPIRPDTRTIAGTVAYMSPEQAEGRLADTRSDIFSFAAVLHEMTTGQPAFPANTEPPPALISVYVPPPLRALIERCLQKDPGLRLQNANELKIALEQVLSTLSDRPSPPSPQSPVPSSPE